MNLATLQARFREWLVTGDEADAAAFGAGAAPGLNIYQNNYRVQLMGCLEVSYPLLRRFMGEQAFRVAAITHIDQNPPRGWTLDHYGADFAATLRTLHPHNPDIDELAWIEWMLGEAFVAKDVAVLSQDMLGGVDWDVATLVLSPSLRIRHAATNADDVWAALHDGQEDIESEMLSSRAGFVIWRQDNISRLRRMDDIETSALVGLGSDPAFGALCDSLVEKLGEAEGIQRAGQLLAAWLASGIVVSIAISESDGR